MADGIEKRTSTPEYRIHYENFELKPLTPHIGAEIRGLDLAKLLTESQDQEVREAFRDWMVLVFSDQELTRDQHKDFGRHFGTLHSHPMHKGGHRGGDPEILPVVTVGDAPPQQAKAGTPTFPATRCPVRLDALCHRIMPFGTTTR